MKQGDSTGVFRPRGALAAVLILGGVVAAVWLAIYFAVFLARG